MPTLPQTRSKATARRGGLDSSAFEKLFRTHYARLRALALMITQDVVAAENALQDAFADVWERRATWNPSGDPAAYLAAVVRNHALRWRRRRRLEHRWCSSLPEDAPAPDRDAPERVLEQAELEHRVRSAIQALPERRRAIFELSRSHGLTYAQIADLLGISVKTVETQIGRALKTLRRCLFAFPALMGLA